MLLREYYLFRKSGKSNRAIEFVEGICTCCNIFIFWCIISTCSICFRSEAAGCIKWTFLRNSRWLKSLLVFFWCQLKWINRIYIRIEIERLSTINCQKEWWMMKLPFIQTINYSFAIVIFVLFFKLVSPRSSFSMMEHLLI